MRNSTTPSSPRPLNSTGNSVNLVTETKYSMFLSEEEARFLLKITKTRLLVADEDVVEDERVRVEMYKWLSGALRTT